jgi:hypothetical protein
MGFYEPIDATSGDKYPLLRIANPGSALGYYNSLTQ